ncbi:MAG: RHS repeat domain-containing protein [Thermoguttaceae bacterium]
MDRILGRLSNAGTLAWYLTDHLGSVRDIATMQGQVIDHVRYDSFGRVLYESKPSAGDRFKFTARELDPTGQYFYRARYYDAALGRFTREDPLRLDAGDLDLYRYVKNAPTRANDPEGLALPGPPTRPRDPYGSQFRPHCPARWRPSFCRGRQSGL